jgi:hypothetical protein
MTHANESAFPEVQELPQFNHHSYGLTKREYFASMAMQGVLSDPNNESLSQKAIAIYAVEMADSLIKELNKEYATFNLTEQ